LHPPSTEAFDVSTAHNAIAKLSAPRLSGVVPRERLFARLDEHRSRPLVWIEGPPGAGKTTLIASWLEARCVATLWYQVDAGDADPASVFHYLCLAIASIAGAASEALPRLVPEHLTDLPAFARVYFRALFATLAQPSILVFDNAQEAETDSPLALILKSAVAELPRHHTIVCISREASPPTFASLIAGSAMVTLRWDALRLTLDETRAIARRRDVTDEAIVRTLNDQSEGWAAGTTLMLEQMTRATASEGAPAAHSLESVFHYLAELLFAKTSSPSRHVLLSVALLPQIPQSIAVLLSEDEDAPRVLESLHRRQLFVDKRAGPEPVYQFHALLREFLTAKLAETLTPEELDMLRRRSADALVAAGQVDAGFALRAQARDWEGAVALIEREAEGLLNTGRWQTLANWVETLPEPVRASHPIALYWLGMARASLDPVSAMEVLRVALDLLGQQGDRRGRLLCLAGLLGATVPGYSAVGVTDQWIDAILPELDAMHEMLSPRDQLQVWGGLCTPLLFARPWHERVFEPPCRIRELLPHVEDPRTRITAATGALGALIAMDLPFEIGDDIVAACEDLADRPDVNPSQAAWFIFSAGYYRFVQARYEEAWDRIERAWRIAERFGLSERLSEVLLFRFMVEFRSLGWSTAEVTWREYKTLPPPKRIVGRALEAILEARLLQAKGRDGEAADLAIVCLALIRQSTSPHLLAIYGLFIAESLVQAHRCAEAGEIVATCRQTIERSPALFNWRCPLALTEAFLFAAQGHRADSVERLTEALSLARRGNARFFLRYLECSLPRMFSLALELAMDVDLVKGLIRLFRLPPPANAPGQWPRPVQIRVLGGFDVQVNGEAPAFSRKLPKKTLALLKVLAAHGGRDVTEDALCDSLWSDEEADAARHALSITVLRLRKLLGVHDAVLHHGGRVRLDRRLCWVDAWHFEKLLESAPDAAAVGEALRLYAGGFLPGDESEPWSVATRERLRGKFVHSLATHGRMLEASGGAISAIDLYQKGLGADPIVEAFHQGLMRCYRALGRPTEAIAAYRRLRQTLSVVLGVAPSAESEHLYRDTLSGMATRAVRPDDAAV